MVGSQGHRGKSSRSSSISCISAPLNTRRSSHDISSWKLGYYIHSEIGRGHFAKVYHMRDRETNRDCAAKVIRRRRGGIDRINSIREEIRIMKKIWEEGVKNVLQLFEVHETVLEVGIVMELAVGGSLFHVTLRHENGLPETYVQLINKKIVSVLHTLHTFNIVHLDLKADNILLRQPYPSTDIVLSDFGLAVQLSEDKAHRELAGTPDYIAPEIINYEKISLNTDMWSLGVLTYFFLTAKSPFMADTKENTMMNISKLNYFFPDDLFDNTKSLSKDFISKLIIKQPSLRLTSKQALSHPWLTQVVTTPETENHNYHTGSNSNQKQSTATDQNVSGKSELELLVEDKSELELLVEEKSELELLVGTSCRCDSGYASVITS